MKKYIAFFLMANFLGVNFYASAFEDELVKNLNPNLKIKEYKEEKIIDDFALKTLDPNLKIKPYKYENISDNTLPKIHKHHVFIKGDLNQKFDFENIEENKIQISPAKYYTTKNNLKEGEYIDFILKQDIKLNNITYKRGTFVKGRVENISQNGAFGVPANLVVDNFMVANNNIEGQINQTGANRAFWVYPTGYCLLPFFFAGLLVFPIRGGHAKLKPSAVYEIGE